MSRVFKSGLWITLFLLATATALAEDPSKTLVFLIKPNEQGRALFGAVVPKGDSWKVHSVGLTVHEVDVEEQSCRITLTGQGIIKQRRKKLLKGESKRYKLVPGQPRVVVGVHRVSEGLCEGRLTITSQTADLWRSLSGDFLSRIPGTASALIRPKVVKRSIPEYTRAALDAGVGGQCMIRVAIAEDGSVDPQSLLILRTVGYGLDEAAIEEVINKWEFLPGTLKGEPVRTVLTVVLGFRYK